MESICKIRRIDGLISFTTSIDLFLKLCPDLSLE